MPLSRALIDGLKQRARERKAKSRKLQPASFPRAVEIEYTRALVSLSREVSDLIRAKVGAMLRRQDAVSQKPVPVTRVIESLRVQIADEIQSKAPAVAAKMVQATAEASRKALNSTYKKVVGIEPWANNSGLAPAMGEALKRNIALIQSIPSQQLDQVERVLAEGFASGARVETIQSLLEDRFDVSESRAELIARDQVGKLNAAFNQERQEQMGVTTYTWQSSNDERVRPMHRDLDGQQFSWNDPPVTNEQGDRNNPGEDYQCRCNAIADIEDVLSKLGI